MHVLTPPPLNGCINLHPPPPPTRMAAILDVVSGRGSRSQPLQVICAWTHFAQRTPPLPKLPWSLCRGERSHLNGYNCLYVLIKRRGSALKGIAPPPLFDHDTLLCQESYEINISASKSHKTQNITTGK